VAIFVVFTLQGLISFHFNSSLSFW